MARYAVIRPVWNPYRRESPVDSKLAKVNEMGWVFTIGEWWDKSADYMEYLITRPDMPQVPEAYKLMAENARRLARGEPITWCVEAFGYPRAEELGKIFRTPPRGKWYVDEVGSPINRNGGISDGSYVQFTTVFLPELYRVTFGIDNMDNHRILGGQRRNFERMSFQEQVEHTKSSGLPFQVIEIPDERASVQ